MRLALVRSLASLPAAFGGGGSRPHFRGAVSLSCVLGRTFCRCCTGVNTLSEALAQTHRTAHPAAEAGTLLLDVPVADARRIEIVCNGCRYLLRQPRHSLRRALQRADSRPGLSFSARNNAQASRHLPRAVALAALPPCGFRCGDWAEALNPQPCCGSLHKRAPRVRTLPSARLCVQLTSPAGVASSP